MKAVQASRRARSRRALRGHRFVIVTGLSGSGKTHAIRALEDLGYFCVDNLPTQLIPTLAELAGRDDTALERVAIVVDVREGGFLKNFRLVFRKLKMMPGIDVRLIYLEASRSTLLRRFSETRRPHPLAPDRSVVEGIEEEGRKLQSIRSLADVIVDTSNLTVHARAAAASAATEQGHAIGFDLCGVALVAVLVVPLTGLQATLDVDLFALGEVFLQALGGFPPQHHAVPFRFFLSLIVPVVPHLGSGEIERGDCSAARRVAQFGIATKIPNQNDFVYAAHVASFRAD